MPRYLSLSTFRYELMTAPPCCQACKAPRLRCRVGRHRARRGSGRHCLRRRGNTPRHLEHDFPAIASNRESTSPGIGLNVLPHVHPFRPSQQGTKLFPGKLHQTLVIARFEIDLLLLEQTGIDQRGQIVGGAQRRRRALVTIGEQPDQFRPLHHHDRLLRGSAHGHLQRPVRQQEHAGLSELRRDKRGVRLARLQQRVREPGHRTLLHLLPGRVPS